MLPKALSSPTRIAMLKILLKREAHISALAEELNISVPVASKHVKILEKSGLIEVKIFGRTHVLKARRDRLYGILDTFGESSSVNLPRGSSLLDALKMVSAVDVVKVGDREFVTSIDGEKGYYIYEIDGEQPNVPIGRYRLMRNAEVKLKKLVAVAEKKINVKVK